MIKRNEKQQAVASTTFFRFALEINMDGVGAFLHSILEQLCIFLDVFHTIPDTLIFHSAAKVLANLFVLSDVIRHDEKENQNSVRAETAETVLCWGDLSKSEISQRTIIVKLQTGVSGYNGGKEADGGFVSLPVRHLGGFLECCQCRCYVFAFRVEL